MIRHFRATRSLHLQYSATSATGVNPYQLSLCISCRNQ
uniref:Uncharacterized protein n=1 Tax=Picea sitchensis TaxID=3332 RepID=A9NUK3_PICSI|nr:unknown [Picea sitchensis]